MQEFQFKREFIKDPSHTRNIPLIFVRFPDLNYFLCIYVYQKLDIVYMYPQKKIVSVEITCSYFWYKTLLFLYSKVKNFKYQIHMNYSSNLAYHFLGWGSQNTVQRLTHPLWQCSSLINRFALQFFSLINLLSNF